MMENTVEYDISSDELKLMVNTLKEIKEEGSSGKFTKNGIEKLRDISYTLSSVLPQVSDASLFEVDDLIYPDNDFITNKPNISRTYSEDSKNQMIKNCQKHFYCTYVYMILRGNQANPMSRILDTTFFQIVEHSQVLNNGFLYGILKKFINVRKENELCMALKLLNIVLDKHKDDITSLMTGIFNDWQFIQLHIQLFQNISKDKHHDKQKKISWISSQVSNIFAKLEEKDIKFPDPMKKFDLQKEECFNVKFIKHLFFKISPTHSNAIHFDLLYSFFMSAKTEEKKLERIKTFVIGLSTCKNTTKFDLAPRLGNVLKVTNLFERYLELISNLGYTDDHLRDIDKYHHYTIEPYLTNTTSPIDSNEQSNQNINSQISADNIPDYTLERTLFYDDFMKRLHVMDIVHTAYMMSPSLFNIPQPDFSNEVFRPWGETKKIITEAFISPSKDGNIPWLLETILNKCPYLILSKNNEHMKDDLIKQLRGEKIDKILEEELFYAVTATGYKDII